MTRPDPPWPAPEGFHHEARPEGDDWRTATNAEWRDRKCRGSRGCPYPPVMALLRDARHWKTGETFHRWYFYCDQHTYGRWIEDDTVMHWIAVEDQP